MRRRQQQRRASRCPCATTRRRTTRMRGRLRARRSGCSRAHPPPQTRGRQPPRLLHAVRRRMAQTPDDAWRRVLLEPLLGALDRLRGETVPAAPPPAITANKTPVVTQPRPADRDAEPVLLQARALSPAKRCEGRALAALSACIERHCKAEPGLRDPPDCARSRREVEQRTAPLR